MISRVLKRPLVKKEEGKKEIIKDGIEKGREKKTVVLSMEEIERKRDAKRNKR
jgi:hypothetical protein